MKIRYQSIWPVIIVTLVAVIYTSCSDSELVNNGEPMVKYIRVTDPVSSDSLLVGAFQSNLVAIIGENLQSAQQVWFNDRRATLTPTYVTNTSILVTVPSEIPKVITNTVTIVFANGNTLVHDFEVKVSAPTITTMKSEYVLAGSVATIRGDFFYEPLTVTFAGGVTGDIVSIEPTLIQVTVPEGAAPGPIKVKTNFGEAESAFWFRDNRNIFISSDPYTGWWNEGFVVKTAGENDPPLINGNYIRVVKTINAWSWLEVAGGPPDAMGPISKNIPDDAILNPAKYNLKFEVNTKKPYNNNVIKINLGLKNDFNNDEYRWLPPYDTKGEWETVVLPLETVMEKFNTSVSTNGYYTRLLFHGPGDLDCDISFDNFRVVPK
ncbi:MAG: hypothetical protein DI538_11045 [Azospira oryzae]|jgi:hypothetical protein|nr:MAG: hypothetical protein DI538_11045 [Azospira oryzae]